MENTTSQVFLDHLKQSFQSSFQILRFSDLGQAAVRPGSRRDARSSGREGRQSDRCRPVDDDEEQGTYAMIAVTQW